MYSCTVGVALLLVTAGDSQDSPRTPPLSVQPACLSRSDRHSLWADSVGEAARMLAVKEERAEPTTEEEELMSAFYSSRLVLSLSLSLSSFSDSESLCLGGRSHVHM